MGRQKLLSWGGLCLFLLTLGCAHEPTAREISGGRQTFCLDKLATFPNLRKKYFDFKLGFPSETDNAAYMAVKDTVLPGRLLFEAENVVLKDLSEVVFSDANITHASINLFKKILFEELRRDPGVGGLIEYGFADYKGVKLIFSKDTPELRKRLKEIFQASLERFDKEISQLEPSIPMILRTPAIHGYTKNFLKWYMAGLAGEKEGGAVASDLASLSGREAKTDKDPGPNESHVIDLGDIRNIRRLSRTLGDIEIFRKDIEKQILSQFGEKSGILKKTAGGKWVLSEPAFAIFRGARKAQTLGEYVQKIQKDFKAQFNVDLPAEMITGQKKGSPTAGGLQKYFHGVEQHILTIYAKHEGVSGFKNPSGLLEFDFEGQGARLAFAIAEVLADSYEDYLPVLPDNDLSDEKEKQFHLEFLRKAVTGIRKTLDAEGKLFETKREALKDGLKVADIPENTAFSPTGTRFSGDDGYFAPKAILTPRHIFNGLKTIHDKGLSVRTAYAHPLYEGTNKPVSDEMQSTLRRLGMEAIKSLSHLKGFEEGKIPPARFARIRFGTLVKAEPGDRKFRFSLFALGDLSPQEARRVKLFFAQTIQDLNPAFEVDEFAFQKD